MHGPYEFAGAPWWIAEGIDPDEARSRITRALDAVSAGTLENQKAGRRKGLYLVRLAGPPGSENEEPFDHLLKRNGYRGTAAWRRRWKGSKAREELRRAELLAARGLPTPIPWAAGEERRGPRLVGCWLLIPRLEGAVDLRTHWEAGGLSPSERRGLADALGTLARQAVDAGLFQDDFAPNNVLIRPGVRPELFMIDFERAQILPQVPEAKIWRSLAKLDREMTGTSRSDRMRFLRAFAGADRRRAWRELEDEAPRLLARDLGHLRRTLRRPGRRFAPLRDGEWSGIGRRACATSELGALRDAGDAHARTRALPRLTPAQGRRVFATAVLLARRGLGPTPAGLWWGPHRSVLVWEEPVARENALEGPTRALLRRLEGLVELEGSPRSEGLVRAAEPGQATFVAPERVRIRGRAMPPGSTRTWVEALS